MARKNSLIYDLQHSLVFDGIANHATVRQYRRQLVPFANWCKKNGIKHLSDIQELDKNILLQQYADELNSTVSSANTIHARLAAPCRVLKVNMKNIKKPKRQVGLNRRSRRFKEDILINKQGDEEQKALGNARLVKFQECVGIRRAELASLTGKDFVIDESGYWCVCVRKGKGGKRQLQRIIPDDTEFCKKYFNGTSEKIFSKKEMTNHIDLHGIRAEQAQRAYRYYIDRMRENPMYRRQLQHELIKRFDSNVNDEKKRKRFIATLSQVSRRCRGDNADAARLIYGTDTLDTIAVMAVSVFHLSHWRADVTVSNYLLSRRM